MCKDLSINLYILKSWNHKLSLHDLHNAMNMHVSQFTDSEGDEVQLRTLILNFLPHAGWSIVLMTENADKM